MNGLNIKQLMVSASVMVGLFILLEISEMQFSSENYAKEVSVPNVPEFSPTQSSVDYTTTLARIDALEPEPEPQPEQVPESSGPMNVPEPVKVLRPNYAFFDDNTQIGLVGIFREKEHFAVLQLIEFGSETTTFQRVALGEQLGPYVLSDIEATSVILRAGDKALSLNLFERTQS